MEKVLLMVLGAVLLIWAWSIFNSVWLRPKKLERYLRKQGLSGDSYKFWFGDTKKITKVDEQAKSTHDNVSHDIVPRLIPSVYNSIMTHGKRSFMWTGPIPRVNVMEPELVKEIMAKYHLFQKPRLSSLAKFFANGVGNLEGEKWVKHRNLLNPAFYMEKLKSMFPAFCLVCGEMVTEWGKIGAEGPAEVDVWPYIQTMTSDIISHTAFGSSYQVGRRIFLLQTEQIRHLIQAAQSYYIPSWRSAPAKRHRRMKEICNEIDSLIRAVINKRVEELKAGKKSDDLLGALLDSNMREVESHGKDQKVGMSIQEVIEECKTFYFAGAETTSILLVWTMILLAKYQNWQQLARKEVLQVFGNKEPDFDGLSRLPIVTMIMNEVLRLYPPVISFTRLVTQDTKLGAMSLPAGVSVFMPAVLIHRDPEIWGSDANEFKPERFAEGVSQTTKNRVAFIPFASGPRFCIGKSFALLSFKVNMAMILKRFSFELSPSYTHAPFNVMTLHPQYGAHLIMHKLQDNA